jgi:multidrug transporter EmrE-like cation transporter
MSAASLSLILTAVFLGAAAQLLLKAGTNAVGAFAFDAPGIASAGMRLAVEPRVLAGVAAYAVSLIAWVLALSRVPVSVAYPMVSLGYVLTVLAAWWWLGESVTPQRLVGVGLIVLGVLLVARS